MFFSVAHEPAALFTFDDGRVSVYDNAFPAMQTRGIKGTNYVHTLNYGPPSFVTIAQMQEMYAAGWAIGNHTHTHLSLPDLTEAEQEAELSTAAGLIGTTWEMPRGANHVAYPFGNSNADTLTAMAATGMLTGRTCDINTLTAAEINAGGLIYKLPIGYVLKTTTLAEVKTWMDAIQRQGRTIILLFHTITETPVGDYDWATADFVALLDYAQSIGMQMPTIDQWYANYLARTGG